MAMHIGVNARLWPVIKAAEMPVTAERITAIMNRMISFSMLLLIVTCFGCIVFLSSLISTSLVLHRQTHRKQRSVLRRRKRPQFP